MKPGPGGFPILNDPVCDCCQRSVERVRGSMWHGEDRICVECFHEWYDPDRKNSADMSVEAIGNHVRSKHGLPPLIEPASTEAGT